MIQKMLRQIMNQTVSRHQTSPLVDFNNANLSLTTQCLTKMAKGSKVTIKLVASKLKVSQKLKAQKSDGQPKKDIHCQKHPASDGSDDTESLEEPEGPRAWTQKKMKKTDAGGKECEEVEKVKEEENGKEVEHVADSDNDNAQSEDADQISL